MRLSAPSRKERPESVVPMINVVFLLLIFFLMSATLAPSDLLDATPPAAAVDTQGAVGASFVIDDQGRFAFGAVRGAEAVQAAAALGESPLRLRADENAPAARLIEAVRRLQNAGVEDVRLTTRPRASGAEP
ncbi:MAG: biopolymer transporter ExbD [Pseudomonadota bacterium]